MLDDRLKGKNTMQKSAYFLALGFQTTPANLRRRRHVENRGPQPADSPVWTVDSGFRRDEGIAGRRNGIRHAFCAMKPLVNLLAVSVFVACWTVSVCAAPAGWNFSVQAQEVKPVNGVITIPSAAFKGGKASYYLYKHSDDQWIRFFVVRGNDGTIKTAFDACDVCFRAKKGYRQEGDAMLCVNCGLKFKTTQIGAATGGCNPHPLPSALQGDKLVITQQDVLSGAKYFR
jgi:uncharacterized membrane protein